MVRIAKKSHISQSSAAFVKKTSADCFRAIGTIRLVVLLVIVVITGIIKAPAQCRSHLAAFMVGPEAERSKAFNRLLGEGVSAIPALIEDVGDKNILLASLAWPGSSTLELQDSYCGVLAAYLIELVLGVPSLSAPLDQNSFLGKEPVNYIYDQGRIVYSKGGKAIKPGDLERLQRLYQQWWTANRAKKIQVLREDWKSGRRPLSNTGFAWK